MRFIVKLLVGAAAITALWFAAWYFLLSADVARVKASIEFQDARFKANNRYVTLKAGSVGRAGFPFAFRVRITRPQLTQIWQLETYGISAAWAELEPVNSAEGRYRLTLPDSLEAVYAKDGELPLQYFVRFTPKPALLVRAAGDSNACSVFPGGKPCPELAPDAPLNAIAFSLTNPLTMHVAQGGQTRDAIFNPPSLQIPVFMEIPADISRHLEIAVEVLKQAMAQKPAQ